MPNHVAHKMIFDMEKCADLIMKMKMYDGITGDRKTDGPLDFNAFCPVDCNKDWYLENINTHGTKWNAYDQVDNLAVDGVLYFDTAWSTASPVWEAIAEQFPNARIKIYYADEDTGNNLGIITIEDGELTVDERSDSPDESKLEILQAVDPGGTYHVCEVAGLCSQAFDKDDEDCQWCIKEYNKK